MCIYYIVHLVVRPIAGMYDEGLCFVNGHQGLSRIYYAHHNNIYPFGLTDDFAQNTLRPNI